MSSDDKTIAVQPVVMAGGSGTRLWPLSRAAYPKQFLVLTADNRSLYQQAVARLEGLAADGFDVVAPLTVGNEEHRFMALDQLRELGDDAGQLLLEPSGRNTAPAMTLAALAACEGGSDPVLVVTPADHVIPDLAAFRQAMHSAIRTAAHGAVVVLGITPDRPETGYGYIKSSVAGTGGAARVVTQFVEKPDAITAERYLADGNYAWNSGMFVLRASTWLDALKRFRPDILDATRSAWAVRKTDQRFVRPGAAEFAAVPAESIDYAVMEHCPGSGIDIRMVPLAAGWNDLGAWDAVWQVAAKDGQGNASLGDAMLTGSRNCLVHASGRLVSLVGVDNLVVVETADAVLVADRDRSQEVKAIVARLEQQGRHEKQLHRKVHRPWGWYDSIDTGPRFQVKRILVKPGASLSLQMHHHRAEHWVVVSGTAEIVNGERTILLSENESTYIPIGQKHRLRNPGKVPLEIIEVQSGAYLGEDDIVRFDDTWTNDMSKVALVTGVTGQDGAYLTELLLAKGYVVHGLKRRASLFNTSRVDHLYRDPHEKDVRFFLHHGDLTDSSNLIRIIQQTQPDEIYNLAAQSHVAVSFEVPEYTADADALGTLRILEAIRILGLQKKTRFYQASTSGLYGLVQETPQKETTPFYPRSPYAVAKLYAYWITVNYREAHGVFACNGILFNHESPLRGENFVTRKITRALARIKLGLQDRLYLGNLHARRDWGHARDYVEAQWLMLQQDQPEDFVIASGVQYSVRDFVDAVCREIELPIRWQGSGLDECALDDGGRCVVAVDPRYFRPAEVETLLGDAGKAFAKLGWRPRIGFEALVREMAHEDLTIARRDELVRRHGYAVNAFHE